MSKYIDLIHRIEKGLAEQRKKGNLPNQCKIDMVVPESELQQYTKKQVLVASVIHELMIPMCSCCTSVRVNGEWMPPSEYTNLLRSSYPNLSFTYCKTHKP